jgi:hypothetical protein
MAQVKARSVPYINLSVKGSLKRHSDWWNNNVQNRYILSVINEGYKLPFISQPVPSVLKNNKSAIDNADFVDVEVDKLVAAGIVIKLPNIPTVVNPLTVAQNADGKKRLVIDLRNVNPLVHVHKFRFEDIKAASVLFTKGCYMVSFDLKSGYHHIDINTQYQQYLGFAWKNIYYCYSSLPFGLSSSGLVFSKVLKELVKRWRAKSIPIVLYLDDGIIIAKSADFAEQYAQIVSYDLLQAGFVINKEKTCWIPKQRIKWLGFNLWSDINVFEVPSEKLFRLQCAIFKNLITRDTCSARILAKTVGKITSLYHALGSVVYLMTKNAQGWIAQKSTWNDRSSLPETV